jgi:hypothetical protein
MKIKSLLAALLLPWCITHAETTPEPPTEYTYGLDNSGTSITIRFEAGATHNHPLFAIWLADEKGKYIQTLYVSESIGKGILKRATRKAGKWEVGEKQRPAALPYWAHQRGVVNEYGTYNPTPRQPVADSYTGATPPASFAMNVRTEKSLKGKYKIMFELNQSWDWNEWWSNDLYPDDPEYKTSSQPALVYLAEIDTENTVPEYLMKAIGHSHYSGANGDLITDLESITTALDIAKSIKVSISK